MSVCGYRYVGTPPPLMLRGCDSKPANEATKLAALQQRASQIVAFFVSFFLCLFVVPPNHNFKLKGTGRRRNWVCWCQSKEYTVSVNFKILTSRRKKKKNKKKKQQKRLSYTLNKNNNITKHATILLRSLTITLLLLFLLLLFFLKGFWQRI